MTHRTKDYLVAIILIAAALGVVALFILGVHDERRAKNMETDRVNMVWEKACKKSCNETWVHRSQLPLQNSYTIPQTALVRKCVCFLQWYEGTRTPHTISDMWLLRPKELLTND